MGHNYFSHHIFMFPIIISAADRNNSVPVNISEVFGAAISSGWHYKVFDPFLTSENYNEFFYFHQYVRNGLFEARSENEVLSLLKVDPNPPQIISYYFEREPGQEAKLVLHILPRPWDKRAYGPYTLKVNHLSLRLFETGAGIVTIELINELYGEMEDVLCINDFGRRLYPQFIGNGPDVLKDPKMSFLPNRIEFFSKDFSSDETFTAEKYTQKDIQIAGYMKRLIGDAFLEKFKCTPAIDDRMYTVCWYGSKLWSDEFSKDNPDNGKPKWQTNAQWYKYIFIDGLSEGCAPGEMREQLVKNHTYSRWANRGTLFGITRYSLMCLTDQEDFSFNVIRKHMETMYYQIAVLLLAQRASVIIFSERVSAISSDIEVFIKSEQKDFKLKSNTKEEFAKIAYEVKRLHASYIRFVNRLWFDEITPQEQGIEIYSAALQAMDLKPQVAELKEEIGELYEFVRLNYDYYKNEEDRKINRRLEKLNIAVSTFIPATLAATVWSGLINIGIFNKMDSFLKLCILVVLILSSCGCLNYLLKEKSSSEK